MDGAGCQRAKGCGLEACPENNVNFAGNFAAADFSRSEGRPYKTYKTYKTYTTYMTHSHALSEIYSNE